MQRPDESPRDATPRLGIALGGGAARGWAHIGVLSELRRQGLEPEIVSGTSIGALVGGIYAAGKLDELEAWVGSLTTRHVFGLLDFTVAGGGVIGGRRLMELYQQHIGDVVIEELPKRFAAVAADLSTGSEVWLREGPLLSAIRASVSLPGLFTPVRRDGRWLIDGGVVNPVPITLCRALGAEVVIGVDLQRGAPSAPPPGSAEVEPAVVQERVGRTGLSGILAWRRGDTDPDAAEATPPSVSSVMAASLDIMQGRLSRSRLAGDPPDLLLTPRVRHVQLLEFAGGRPTIEEGCNVVRRAMPALNDILGRDVPDAET